MTEKNYNKMCLDCPHLEQLCSGTTKQFWSGCIWKTATDAEMISFLNNTGENKRREEGRKNDSAV